MIALRLPQSLVAALCAASLLGACATGPQARPDAATPEIPEDQRPTVQRAREEALQRQQQLQVVKTVPAPGAAQAAAPAPAPAPVPAPEPPKPPIDPAAKAAFARGNEATRAGNLVEAEKQYKLSLERDPKLTFAWTNLGVVYERRDQRNDAEAAYEKALELEPENAVAWDYLARLRCRTGQASDVEARLRLQIGKTPAALGPRLALVYTLLYQQKLESAATEAKKVLKADERNVLAMQLLSQAYYREKKYELAKMILENAKAIAPGDAATWNALGLVNLAMKQKPQALESFQQAVALQPDFAEANNNYGALLNETDDYDNAVKVLEAAVRAAPDFAEAHLNLANAYRGKQQFKRAIAEYEQVTRLRPKWADTYYNLAILHLDSELPELQTIPRLKQAITYFLTYQQKGGKDDRVGQYMKDANKGIEKEEHRLERLEKDKLRKAAKEVEAKKKAEEEARARAEEEKKKAELAAGHDRGTTTPASKLGDAQEGPAPTNPPPAPQSGKLGEDEK